MKMIHPGFIKKILLSLGIMLYILHIPAYLYTKQSFTVSEEVIKKYAKRYGNKVAPLLNDWISLINTYQHNELETLKKVNDFFNTFRFIDDIIHWKQEDYWATPIEFIASGAGDCEDFSIAKYYTLIKVALNETQP